MPIKHLYLRVWLATGVQLETPGRGTAELTNDSTHISAVPATTKLEGLWEQIDGGYILEATSEGLLTMFSADAGRNSAMVFLRLMLGNAEN